MRLRDRSARSERNPGDLGRAGSGQVPDKRRPVHFERNVTASTTRTHGAGCPYSAHPHDHGRRATASRRADAARLDAPRGRDEGRDRNRRRARGGGRRHRHARVIRPPRHSPGRAPGARVRRPASPTHDDRAGPGRIRPRARGDGRASRPHPQPPQPHDLHRRAVPALPVRRPRTSWPGIGRTCCTSRTGRASRISRRRRGPGTQNANTSPRRWRNGPGSGRAAGTT